MAMDPTNWHGLQMSDISNDICPESFPDCWDSTQHVLVTPRNEKYAADWLKGEEAGLITDFSTGLYYAIQSWRQRMAKAGPDAHWRLVVNASVGVDVDAIMATDDGRATMGSVKDMLTYASCLGVIVVSSSGNVRDEACPAGEDNLLAPASYEHQMMPNLDECMSLGFAPDWDLAKYPVFPAPGVSRPLVYALGGVTGGDEQIDNARPNSEPRLVATAAHGIGAGGGLPLTGTSLGSIVGASTARLVWGADPGLRPDQVMQAVYDGGYSLGRSADDGHWAGDDVHRISVCGAVDQVAGIGCTAPAPEPDAHLTPFFSASEAIIAGTPTTSHVGLAPRDSAVCEPDLLDELIDPQPELPVCAFCSAGIVSGGLDNDTIYIDVDEAYEGKLTSVRMLIDTGTAIEQVTLDATVVDQLNNSNPALPEIHEVMFDAPPIVLATSLQFYLGRKSQTNTIPFTVSDPTP